VERPKLRLDVPLHAVGAADDDALTKAALDEALSLEQCGQRLQACGEGRSRCADGSGCTPEGVAALYKQKFNQENPVPSDGKARTRRILPRSRRTSALWSSSCYRSSSRRWISATIWAKHAPPRYRARCSANTELQPERVFLTERESSGGEDGKVKMELKLE
jgi:hypothetical protein